MAGPATAGKNEGQPPDQAAVAEHGARAAKQVGIETRNLASRAAAAILEALGLESVEAAKRAAEPLPQLETKASFA